MFKLKNIGNFFFSIFEIINVEVKNENQIEALYQACQLTRSTVLYIWDGSVLYRWQQYTMSIYTLV